MGILDKKCSESDFDYKERLIITKLEGTIDLDWCEIVSMLELDCSVDHFRKVAKGIYESYLNRQEKQLNNISDNNLLSDIEYKKIELEKEKRKFYDQRTAFSKLVTIRARQEELNEIIQQVVEEGNLPQLDYTPCNIRESDSDMLVSLCDMHYGANIDNAWNFYNSDVCRERLCKYIDEIDAIQKTHRTENCIVWANGDMISGNIHNEITVTNKENVIEQITGVSELIAEFLAELSKRFSKVKFVSVAGNHSRLDTKERSLKDERLDDLIEWYLKARLQNFENILISDYKKLDSTMYCLNIRGLNYIGVHGDYDDSETKIQSLKSFVPVSVKGILFGHKHYNSVGVVQGIKTIMAGSFLGMDQYCISKRIYSSPQQLVCIMNENGIKCYYDINF